MPRPEGRPAAPAASILHGVAVLPVVTHADERGFFREVLRAAGAAGMDRIAQVSHSLVQVGVVKAWHLHAHQVECWYVATGVLRLVLHDLRADSPTRGRTEERLLGDGQPAQVVVVPPGVAHGCKCISGPTNLIYLESLVYAPEEDQKMSPDDPRIGYDWSR
jgi:dTDP-4-dehydrorhamnose 3,5-epimerase